eukprot:541548-Pyramimonas_sp.AAC.1
MEGITVYQEEIVCDLNCIDKERLHLWTVLCSHGRISVTDRRMLKMTSTSSSFKNGKWKAVAGHDLRQFSYQYPMGIA